MSQQQANQQEADDFGNRPSQELTAMSVRATEGGRNDELGLAAYKYSQTAK